MMHGPEKSDRAIVAGKPANKAEQSAAESVERRAGAKGNAHQQSTHWTQSQARVSQALERIRQAIAVIHPRWEPYAGKPPVRFCAGGAMKIASLPLRAKIKRRAFITLLGGAAVAWPLAARAQQAAVTLVGCLDFLSAAETTRARAKFRQGLAEAGYIEGRNVTIEYRWAEGRNDRLPALAEDLVHRQATVIVATGSLGAVLAAKAATSTIPIVFVTGVDPVKHGLVASFNRPGGNLTGVNFRSIEVASKRIQFVSELAPHATTIAFLAGGSRFPTFEEQTNNMYAAARALG